MKLKYEALFWWLEGPKKIFIDSFGWLILLIIIFLIPPLRIWWWFFTPIILLFHLKTLYLWWISWDYWYPKNKWVVLKLIPPKEVLAPFSAMEDVFSTAWSVLDKANWREIWCEGEFSFAPFWLSWEIASIEGKVNFYVRCLRDHQRMIESVLYSHYPELEIVEVEDYTKIVPHNIPNEDWDLYGEDYILLKEDCYPIKTYSKFFEPSAERIREEKRIDPIISLLENMSSLGPGEHAWLQIITTPFLDIEIPWKAKAQTLITKLSRRPTPKSKSILESFLEALPSFSEFSSALPGVPSTQEKAISPAVSESGEKEMIITPGEREVLSAIEEKIKKLAFKVNIRGVYIAKRDCWNPAHSKIVRSYFPHFSTSHLNSFFFLTSTRPKIHYIMRERRKYLRQRKVFKCYLLRVPASYPRLNGPGNIILNTEELATIFHFPTKITGTSLPSMSRIEAKKGGPPLDLPTE